MLIKVAIVERDLKVLKNLVQLINSTKGFCCVSEHPRAEFVIKKIAISMPDVVLMGIDLPGMNGVEITRRLKRKFPEIRVVMLTVYENISIFINALSAGVCGYLPKHSSPEQIIETIRDAHGGGSPISSVNARGLMDVFQQTLVPVQGYGKLSMRELQVIDLLAKGFTYKEISRQLDLSYSTVHTHIRHIYTKLQVKSRTSAVAMHLRHVAGWMDQAKLGRAGVSDGNGSRPERACPSVGTLEGFERPPPRLSKQKT